MSDLKDVNCPEISYVESWLDENFGPDVFSLARRIINVYGARSETAHRRSRSTVLGAAVWLALCWLRRPRYGYLSQRRLAPMMGCSPSGLSRVARDMLRVIYGDLPVPGPGVGDPATDGGGV